MQTLSDGLNTQLRTGVVKLNEGGLAFKAGIEQLYAGTKQAAAGGDELNAGTSQVTDGINKLYDGSVTLDDGMAEYKDKAVGKLKDFADNDLSEVIGRVEATVEAANDYTIFTAAADNKSTSVKFIYETEEISNDED